MPAPRYFIFFDGIKTTLPLFQDLVANQDIANGDYDIHWLEKYLAETSAK